MCQLRALLPPYTAGAVQEPRGHRLPAEILQSHQQVQKSTTPPKTANMTFLYEHLIHPRQSLPHNDRRHSDPVSLQQQKPAHMKIISGFETNCLRMRGMLSFPLRNQTEKTEIGFLQQ